ncbi:CHAT domain-containing protein [Algoriphagus lacus]|uniref:CHAT domain-containing protein n=1 Tax=Algoriphagus lacus TaxID=2056311 RepID=A0A418PQL8_9BACT|nr:CHAT domain-containing tetratricopeptide repeat protein [Algoriphagus lacus]RIW14525.1 CHAT domain-containing protein [Algoriphagus lacus]
MNKHNYPVFFICLILIFVGTISISQETNPKLRKATDLYFLPNPTEKEDLDAIRLFEEALNHTPDQEESKEFVIASEHLGNLLLSYGQVSKAVERYRQGITWARAYRQPDTLVYNHHLFLGEALFSISQLDSSLVHLQVAERLQNQLKGRGEPERLYNALGVYFFETGNYIRSISYFDKAQSYLTGDQPELEVYARYSFQSNKASALYHLGEYDSAQRIYTQLLDFNINQDQIRINLANTFLQEGESEQALAVLNQISPDYKAKSLSFFNLKAKSHLLSGNAVDAKESLDQAEKLILQDSSSERSFQKGVWMEVKGDYFRKIGKNALALVEYQKAIVELLPGFEDLKITSNPVEFSLGMSSLTLFEVLTKKAETAWEIHRSTGEESFFELGLGAWQSAFGLSQFISVNFDNDKARVFLSEKALIAFESGIEQLMAFSELKKKEELVWKAFQWVEQSKAGGLRIGAMQEKLKRKSQLPEELIQEERNLLFAIFRNSQKQFADPAPEVKAALAKEAVDLEVQLSRLREKFKDFPGFGKDLLEPFDLKVFQQSIPEKSFVLSFFMGDSTLFVFGIGREKFSWKNIPLTEVPFSELNRWIGGLVKEPSGSRYDLNQEIARFGASVLGPFEQEIVHAKELVLIPQGVLNSVPFELLPDAEGKFLYQRIPVIYQFSAQFIQHIQGHQDLNSGLGLAPFSDPENSSGFSPLPQSSLELDAISGEKFVGKEALKSVFLEKSENADFIHLATHAVASSVDPNQAFIAFYPEGEDFRLFAPELAFQSLEKAKLVFLSACETGAGQLSKSEGLISLARSLAFAGAEQMIITQWVSEDRVAAYISGRFYRHVADGMTFASALYQAKLDLLDDPEMAQYHHPFYWANFRLIGQPNDIAFPQGWMIWVGFLIILLPAGFWIGVKFWNQRAP